MHLRLATSAALATLLSACSCGTDPQTAAVSAPLISDAVHNDGTPGFYFLPPLVTYPAHQGDFEPNAEPAVEIWALDAAGELSSLIAVYTMWWGTGGELVVANPPHRYTVNWITTQFELSEDITYRIVVLAGDGRELGYADVDLVANKTEVHNINRDLYVAMVDGYILPINFRVEREAVDADGDHTVDWNDNCPEHFNVNQEDADDDGIGDVCECDPAVECDDGNPCTYDDCRLDLGCFSTPIDDGPFEASEDTECGTGACTSAGSTECEDGEIVDTCEPGEPAFDDATCDGIDDDCDEEIDEDCAATCGAAPQIPAEIEPNDELALAMPLGLSPGTAVTIGGELDGWEDYDVFSFEVLPGDTVYFSARISGTPGDITSCNGESVLVLSDDQGIELTYAEDGWFTECPILRSYGPLATGSYYLWHFVGGESSGDEYVLDARLSLPPLPELEDNDDPWTATDTLLVGPGFRSYSGDLEDGRDVYRLEVPPGESLALGLSIFGTAGDPESCNGSIEIEIGDEWDEYYEFDDGPDGCPRFDFVPLWEGTWYVTVESNNGGEGGGECGECGCEGCGGEGEGEGEGGGDSLPYVLELELRSYDAPDVCGDGVVTGCEQCDGGECCSDFCTLIEAGTSCSIWGTCGTGSCDGIGAGCPVDTPAGAGTECRPAFGGCDVAEVCDGASMDCPADQWVAADVLCGPSQGPCDVEDRCTGSSPYCFDELQPYGVLCREAAGVCDAADYCAGWTSQCFDGVPVGSSSIVCRASAGVCDPEERCSPSSSTCPEDQLHDDSTICRISTAPCDAEERCSGADPACPADLDRSEGEVCRVASSGSCDVAETCTAAGECPDDQLATTEECLPEAHWARAGGLGAPAFATRVRLDAAHNIYVGGGVLDTSPWSINGYRFNHHRTDNFVAKYGPEGDLLWYYRNDAANRLFRALPELEVAPNGDVLLLELELTDFTATDMIRMLSGADGSVLWSMDDSNGVWTGRGSVNRAMLHPSGDLILYGSVGWNTCWGFDIWSPGLGFCMSQGGLWIARYSAAGVPLWYRTWGTLGSGRTATSFSTIFGHLTGISPARDSISRVLVDPAGDVFLVGTYGLGHLTAHKVSGLDGSDLWNYISPGAPAGVLSVHTAVDPGSGDLYLGGHYSSGLPSVDLGTGPLPAGNALGYELYLLELDSTSGTPLWSRRFGGTGADSATGLAAGAGGELVLSALTTSPELDLGGGALNMASGSTSVAFVAGFDGGGDYRWTRRLSAIVRDVAVGSVVVTGSFTGTQDFDGTFLSAPLYDYGLFADGEDYYVYVFTPRETTIGNGQLDPGEACDSGGCCTIFANFSPAGTMCGPGNATCTGTSDECVITCGNGQLDPGEPCDQGDCCTPDCTLRPSTFVCREVATAWDVAETCSGGAADCPSDQLAPHGAICDDEDDDTHSDVVGPADTCAGTTKTCPPDTPCVSYSPAGDGTPFCTPLYQPQGTPCSDGVSCVPGRSKVCDGFGLCVYAGGAP